MAFCDSRHLIYDGLGLGLEPTIRRLHQPGLDLEGFEQWVEACNGGALPAERAAWTNASLALALGDEENGPPDFTDEPPPLSPEEIAFFEENGYVVLKGAVPPAQAEAALAAVWRRRGCRRTTPSRGTPVRRGYRRPLG